MPAPACAMTRVLPSDQPEQLSLARRSIRGAAWNYSGAIVVTIGQLAYTALTARLVSPAEFGAYAVAQALLALVGYFTLGTIGNAIIRQRSIDRRFIGTAVAITVVAGAIVAAFVLAVAGVWADIWRSPDAVTLIRLFAPQMLAGAVAIVPLALLRRNLRYRAASMIETSATIAGFGVGSVLAIRFRNAEALVLGQVAGACALGTLGFVATRSQLAIAFGRVEARSLLSFSAQVSLQNLGHYVNTVLPSFAVSRSLGATTLGFYSRASLLVGLPLTFLAQGVTKTLYPIFPRFRDDDAECRRMMVDVASVTTTFVWPLFAALAGLAPLVVDLLLGPRWDPAAAIVLPLCLYGALNFTYVVFIALTESFGYLRQIWLVQACWSVVLVGSLAVAIGKDADMRTIAFIAAGIQAGVNVLQMKLLAHVRAVDFLKTVRVELWAALLALIWYGATMMTTRVLTDSGLPTQIVVSTGVLLLLTLGSWLALPHLPAGRAFAGRGIRITWRTDAARLPDDNR